MVNKFRFVNLFGCWWCTRPHPRKLYSGNQVLPRTLAERLKVILKQEAALPRRNLDSKSFTHGYVASYEVRHGALELFKLVLLNAGIHVHATRTRGITTCFRVNVCAQM